jgi:hypothetical protein
MAAVVQRSYVIPLALWHSELSRRACGRRRRISSVAHSVLKKENTQMAGFAGFDTSVFPGIPEMKWLKANTNLVWCGYYLGPAPSRSGTSWMGQRNALQALGWGLAPLYVGQHIKGLGSHNVTGSQGRTDGGDAASLLKADGFPSGTCVYLDLEDGPPFTSPRSDYVAAWADAVQAGGFQTGVYCSHAFAAEVHSLRSSARVWAFKVETTNQHPFPGTNFPDLHPAGCGYPGAYIWQPAQNCRLSLPGAPLQSLLVDLDCSVVLDPGAP